MYCVKCGAKLDDDVLFCTECGTKAVKIADDGAGEETDAKEPTNEAPAREQPPVAEPAASSSHASATNTQSSGFDFDLYGCFETLGSIIGKIGTVAIIIGLIVFFNTDSGKVILNDIIAEFNGGKAYIEMVQNSGEENMGITYGELAEAALNDVEWSYFRSEDDRRVVELNGLDAIAENEICIQFVITHEEGDLYRIEPYHMSVNGVSIKDILSQLWSWV